MVSQAANDWKRELRIRLRKLKNEGLNPVQIVVGKRERAFVGEFWNDPPQLTEREVVDFEDDFPKEATFRGVKLVPSSCPTQTDIKCEDPPRDDPRTELEPRGI